MSRRRRQAAALLLISTATFVVSVMISVVVVDDVLHDHTPTPTATPVTPTPVVSTATTTATTADPTVTPTPEPPPQISCEPPSRIEQEALVTCRITDDIPEVFAWRAPEGGPTVGVDVEFVTSFSTAGPKTITLEFCNESDCGALPHPINVLLAQIGVTLSCPPAPVNITQEVSCVATVNGGPAASVEWRVSNVLESEDDLTLTKNFSEVGTETIHVEVCDALRNCDEDSRIIVLSEVAGVKVKCPTRVLVAAPVVCGFEVGGDTQPSGLAWSADNGHPSTSNEVTIQTSFDATGEQQVNLKFCLGDLCDQTSEAFVFVIQPPRVTLSCAPDPIPVGEELACVASVTGGPADTYEWTPSDRQPVFGGETFETLAVGPKEDTITVEVCNLLCATASDSVTVVAPPLVSVGCTPSPVATHAEVTCTATLIEGSLPVDVDWMTSKHDPIQTDSLEFKTSFSSGGLAAVAVEVRNLAGRSVATTPVEVVAPPLLNLSCPSPVFVNSDVNCTVSNSGGKVTSYQWETSAGPVRTEEPGLRPSFSKPTTETITVEACNEVHVCDSDSTTVEVVEQRPILRIVISCDPLDVNVNHSVQCTASIINGPADTIDWTTSTDVTQSGGTTFDVSFAIAGTPTITVTACNFVCDSDTVLISVFGPPDLLASPNPLTFEDPCIYEGGNLISCPDSVSQPVTLTNSGEGQLSITSTSIDAPFSVSESTCTTPLDAGQSCQLTVAFVAPHSAGSVTATLTIRHTGSNDPLFVPIHAQGSPPLMVIESFDVSFSGDCFCDGQMWLNISFLVTGDSEGSIQLWRKKIGHSWHQVAGDFAVGEINQFRLSQDDDQTWKYRLFATNSVGESAVPETRMLEGSNQCLVIE